ncbi:MAG TPA: hypothetical protein HPP97_13375 [Desulfuromonadales bacterium]|nr:hypothetical protein [Desulfuromonadales bacterium]
MPSIKKLAISSFIALQLAACGGGGSSSNAPIVPPVTPNTTSDSVIPGMASKGPIDGNVAVYAIAADGSRGTLLKGGVPVTKGVYSVNIGKYDVPVLIEVSGSYTDEATGAVIPLDKPLRAALASSVVTSDIAITPLTELAVQKAEQKTGGLSKTNINDSNKLLSDIFKFDIITTQPLDPSKAALSGSSVTQDQKDYTLALAALSQLSKTQGVPLADTLKSFASGISSTGMTSQTLANFKKAVTDFKATGSNGTVFKDSNLAAINGAVTASFTLALQGDFAANAIKGIQFEVLIPQGLTVRSDATGGATLPGIVTLSPLTSAAEATQLSWYNPTDGVLHIGVTSTKGFGAGDLVTITCDIVPHYLTPSATAFSVRNIKADGGSVDGTTVTISGVTVTVR